VIVTLLVQSIEVGIRDLLVLCGASDALGGRRRFSVGQIVMAIFPRACPLRRGHGVGYLASGYLGHRVGPVDEVLCVLRADERVQLLADERGEHECPELTVHASEPSAARLGPDDDQRPPGSEDAPELRQRSVAPGVEDHVVSVLSVCEVVEQ